MNKTIIYLKENNNNQISELFNQIKAEITYNKTYEGKKEQTFNILKNFKIKETA
jgi:hypothetical protein